VRPDREPVFFQKTLEIVIAETIMLVVPLDDDFGDWATPKESKAGHFLRPFPRTALACPPPLRWY
jgi:hypothetical protein